MKIKSKYYSWILIVVSILFTACSGKVKVVKQDDLYHRLDEYKPEDQVVTAEKGYNPSKKRDGYKLVWSDEFNGAKLDTSVWTYEVNGDGGGNNELQYYTDFKTNSWVKNGLFHIKVIKETYNGKPYTSARIVSRYKKGFTFGRFDIRAKVPVQQGIWPAIWMLPTYEEYGSWPMSGEIDIMESVGHEPNTVHGTIHFGPKWPNNKYSGNKVETQEPLSENFHVYSVEWEADEIRWYLDDVLYSTKTVKDLEPYPWRFDKEFYLILNLAVGGNWPGNPDETTEFPKYMFVDYVRVYKKIEN